MFCCSCSEKRKAEYGSFISTYHPLFVISTSLLQMASQEKSSPVWSSHLHQVEHQQLLQKTGILVARHYIHLRLGQKKSAEPSSSLCVISFMINDGSSLEKHQCR